MKKIFSTLAILAVVFAFSCCKQKDYEAALQQNDSLQSIINAKDGEIDALFDMLNQIEDNLTMISAKYSAVQEMKRGNTEANYNVKGEITEQISNIESMLAANKQKIADLNSKLAALGKENSKLQEFVTKLEERVASQEAQISELLTEVENNKAVIKGLNQNVSDLTASNQAKDATIAQQIAEANKAYFIVGSYSELKEMGIVSKSGGFIGIGKKQSTNADMELNKFTVIDRTKITTITINQKKAVVISKHPESSFELVKDENDESVTAYLRILNPAKFWEQTRYLVVSTK